MLCSAHVKYGAAILTYDDPEKSGYKITLILAIFKNTGVTCEVKDPDGEKGVGEYADFQVFFLKLNFQKANLIKYLIFNKMSLCYRGLHYA